MNENEVEELRSAIRTKYPELIVAAENGEVEVRGSFPVVHEGEILDRFLIHLQIPPKFPDEVPTLREIGGRIPRTAARHTNPDGTSCPSVPEEWLVLPREKRTVLAYLDVVVRNFLIFQALVERGEPWPWGERDHGRPGLLQAYGDMLGMATEPQIAQCLRYLDSKKLKGHWPCPCGSGKKLRDCHFMHLRTLRETISRKLARQALSRLASGN